MSASKWQGIAWLVVIIGLILIGQAMEAASRVPPGGNIDPWRGWLGGAGILVLFGGLSLGVATERAATNEMWEKRRKRWLAGGWDPAYPNDDEIRRKQREADL